MQRQTEKKIMQRELHAVAGIKTLSDRGKVFCVGAGSYGVPIFLGLFCQMLPFH